MRIRHRAVAVVAAVLFAAAGSLPATAGTGAAHQRERPSAGRLSAEIRYTEYGIPHILAKDYASLGFGEGYAQAADQVCTLADGFVTLRGERARHFGADAKPDGSLSSASTNLTSDLYFRGVREAHTVEKLLAERAPLGPSTQVRDLMRGWAAGYNTWLARHEITDPACRGARWVKPVTSLDVAVRGYAVAVLAGEGRAVDALTTATPPTGGTADRSSPEAAPDPRAAARAARELFAQDRADMGSNAVAFSGATTANGRVCCSATRTTRGRGAAASGRRSSPCRANSTWRAARCSACPSPRSASTPASPGATPWPPGSRRTCTGSTSIPPIPRSTSWTAGASG
jgi:acyl-homoserine-lactone acylase